MPKKTPLIIPPVAQKTPHLTKIHGVTLRDDYFWLREKENPQVTAYLESENTYSNSWLKNQKPLENKLFREILSKIRETDASPPHQAGSYMYFNEIKKGEQYPRRYRYPIGKPKQKSMYFDDNREAKKANFFAVGALKVSPCETMLAYSKDDVGFRQYQLFVRDLESDKDSKLIAQNVGSVAWACNSQVLLYTIEDHAKRQHKVIKHVMGTNPKHDVVIFEETDERFRVSVSLNTSQDLIFIGINSHTSSEYHFAPADLSAPFKKILPRKKDVQYGVAYRKDTFFVMSNDLSQNFRISKLPVKKIGKWRHLKTFLKPTKGAVYSDFDLFENHMVISERSNGLEQLLVHSFVKKQTRAIKFPEETYSLGGSSNALYHTHKYRFSYSSMVTPPSVFDVDLNTLKISVVKEFSPRGKYQKSEYKTERVFAKAKDGTKIPISLVYKKSLFKKGHNPSLLSAYGSYGMPMDASFDSSVFPLLDRGFVIATLHIRGGGEFGKPWHDAGKMQKKRNTFTDFIDSTKHLIKNNLVASENIFIEGGSAGGLLMGAAVNMAPRLYRGVLSFVPFVDVINSMLDENLPLTVGEFEEWGNPKKKSDFKQMIKYSPYDNLKVGEYPAMWIRTSLHDSQVMYWEPAKYTAKLRTLKTDCNPLYLLVDMKAGHGGASGRYDSYRERAQDYVFILKHLNMPST